MHPREALKIDGHADLVDQNKQELFAVEELREAGKEK
jgi:hypothetical protein